MRKLLLLFILLNSIISFAQESNKYLSILTKNILDQYQKHPEYIEEKNTALHLVTDISVQLSLLQAKKESILFQKAFSLMEIEKIQDAINILDDNTLIKEDNPNCYLLKARLLLSNLQFYEAEIYYEKSVKRISPNFNNLYEFANFYMEQKMFSIAKLTLEEALLAASSDFEEAKTYKRLGELYQEWNQFLLAQESTLKAKNIFEKLFEVSEKYHPYLAEIYNNLGIINDFLKKEKESDESFKKSIKLYQSLLKKQPEINGQLAEVYLNIGLMLIHFRKTEDALNYFNKATEIYEKSAKSNPIKYKPKLADTYYNKGLLYKIRAEYDKALSSINKTLEIYENLVKTDSITYLPIVADVQSNLAVIYTDLGQFDKALENFNKAQKQFNQFSSIDNYHSQVGIANIKII